MVELILVTLLLGMLVAVAPPLVPVSRQGLDGAIRKVYSDLLYARQMSLLSGSNRGASFTAGGGYLLYFGTPATPISDPVTKEVFTSTHGQSELARFGNIFITSSYQVEFDSTGRPVMGGGGSVILSNGTNTKSILVTSNTGLLEIQ